MTVNTIQTRDYITTKTDELYKLAEEVTPGGVHSNQRWYAPHPLFFKRGRGSKLWDVDGNEYVDFVGNFAAIILGHGEPKVVSSINEALEEGLSCSVETERNIRVSKKFISMVPCAKMVRFSSTGTEAVIHALHIARGYSKRRDLVVKMEGSYHGFYDYVFANVRGQVRQADSPLVTEPDFVGLADDVNKKTIVVPWNNSDALEQVVGQNKDKIAAVIMEPVFKGVLVPPKDYLKHVREITQAEDIPLIFDEIITGFRGEEGGAHQFFNIIPDLAVFGKAFANGLPIGAVGGRRDLMELVNPKHEQVSYKGTHNANQIVLAAADATLDIFRESAVAKNLHNTSSKLVRDLNEIASNVGLEAETFGYGGRICSLFAAVQPIVDYQSMMRNANAERSRIVSNEMLSSGIYWLPGTTFPHGITSAHSKEDIDKMLAVAENAYRKLKA